MKEIFKKRLKEEIQQNGMNTIVFAHKIGVTPEMVTQYFTTSKMPRIETFEKICRVLDVSADYLLGISDIP